MNPFLCRQGADIKVVMIDDCSTDDSPGILDEYQAKFEDKEFSVVRINHAVNIGAQGGIDFIYTEGVLSSHG